MRHTDLTESGHLTHPEIDLLLPTGAEKESLLGSTLTTDYFGNPLKDGSWRINFEDPDLLIQVRVAGEWTAGSFNAYVCVQDKKAQNTNGGTFTSGAWRTRDINDEQADAAGICSIASNQITLSAGTYRCLISAPAYKVRGHQTRLYNDTDAAVLLVGTSEYASSLTDAETTTRSFIAGRFTLATSKVLSVQHQCITTALDNGFGNGCNFTDEIYTIAEFWREA